MKAKITKRLLDGLTPPEGDRTIVHDTMLPGFRAVKHASGVVSFLVVYGPRTCRRKLTLGQLGPLTVEKARDLAKARLGDVAQGRDPAEEMKQRRATPTFKAWVAEYLPEVEQRKKSASDDKRYLEWAAESWRKAINKVSVNDVRHLVEKRRKDHGPISANRFLASVRTCLQAAWRAGWVLDNPAMKVQLLPENEPRARVLSDEELKAVLDALEALTDPWVRLAFDMLLSTGARKSEVLRARWEDIDLEHALWRIPSPKAGKPQVVPLPKTTVARLQNTPRVGEWVIPGRKEGKPRDDLRKPWLAVRKAAGVEDVTIHDLRRTYGLHVARTAGLHVASKLLRHSTVRITEQVYAPLGIDELRAATEKVARKRAKVIKLKQKGATDDR